MRSSAHQKPLEHDNIFDIICKIVAESTRLSLLLKPHDFRKIPYETEATFSSTKQNDTLLNRYSALRHLDTLLDNFSREESNASSYSLDAFGKTFLNAT